MENKTVKRIIHKGSLGIIVLSFILCFSTGIDANQGPGTTGAAYLLLPVNARAIAMGEAGTGLTGGAFGWLDNPGSNAGSGGTGVGIFHSQWSMDTYYDNAFFTHPVPGGLTMNVALTYMSAPEVQGYNEFNEKTTGLKNNNFQWIVGIGYAPIESLGVGVNIKYFQERIADWTARGYGMDIGAAYSFPFPHISLGVSVQNLGPDIKFIEHEEELPLTLRLGGSYRIPVIVEVLSFTLAANMVTPKHEDTFAAFGGELSFRDICSVRAGYTDEKKRANDGFTAGAGVKLLDKIILDYAWTPYGDLGSFHRISLFIQL